MKLSSAYLYEQLSKEYEIREYAGISEKDAYLRPFLCGEATEKSNEAVPLEGGFGAEGGAAPSGGSSAKRNRAISHSTIRSARPAGGKPGGAGHVCVIPARTEEAFRIALRSAVPENSFRVFAGPAFACGAADDNVGAYVYVALKDGENAVTLLNDLQQVFDCCDAWDGAVNELLTENAGIGKILELTSQFLGNPLMVMGLDFSLVAEAGAELLPERARLFTDDGVNIEYMNALLQDGTYRELAREKETVLFPGYISGFRSLNRNLFVEGQPTHRLVLTECKTAVTPGNICILEALTGRLEYLLSYEVSSSLTGDLEQIFQTILTDRTADYVQVSRRLSAAGWSSSHEYLCLILQITYLNQKQLSTKALCRYIKKQLSDSISFLYQEEVVTFFNLTRLGLNEEETAAKLVYFIRDSYLKAGYSRTMRGHMNLRRQYVQARTALDVGSRKKPYLWIHHFSQVALTYMIEQATKRLPGNMLCHEGLLKLQEQDAKNHTEYMITLKTYLEQHLNATQAAKELFIHRSTFLYRLEKIKEILNSDLEDPEEIFYLELSLRLLEQEAEKS